MSNLDIVRGRSVVLNLTNQSGGTRSPGDVVVIDTANNEAFTVSSTSNYATSHLGIVDETIGIASNGRVVVSGYARNVKVSGTATRGEWLYHSATQATGIGGAAISAGAFGQFLKGGTGTTPSAIIFATSQIATSGGGSSTLTVQDEGSPLSTAATTLNFVGGGVTASGTGATKTITIPSVSASGARVRNSAAINLNNGSVTILTFDTERWDDAAYHSTSADTERLTVAAGRYLIGGHCQITAAGGTVGYIAIRQGGTNYIAVQNFDIGNAERYVSIATTWDCAGADYFEFGVFIDAGSKQALQSTSFTPEFWIERLGDT